MVYNTQQAAEYMNITPDTLRVYRKILGIEPRKAYGKRGRYYLYPDLLKMMALRYPPNSLYQPRLLDRYESLRKSGELDKDGEE
jgi:hypothetical protein